MIKAEYRGHPQKNLGYFLLSFAVAMILSQLVGSPIAMAQNGPFSGNAVGYGSVDFLGRQRISDPVPTTTVDRLILSNTPGPIQIGFINFWQTERDLRPLTSALNACAPTDQGCITYYQQAVTDAYHAHQYVVTADLSAGDELFIHTIAQTNNLKVVKKDSQGHFTLLQNMTIGLRGSSFVYPAQRLAFASVSGTGPISAGGGYSVGADMNLPEQPPLPTGGSSVTWDPHCRVIVIGGGSSQFWDGFTGAQPSNLLAPVKQAVDEFNRIWKEPYYLPKVRVSDIWYKHSASIAASANQAHQDIQYSDIFNEKLLWVNHCQGTLVANKVLEDHHSTYYDQDRTFAVINIDPPFTGWTQNSFLMGLHNYGGGNLFYPIARDLEPGSPVLTHMDSTQVPREDRRMRLTSSLAHFDWKKKGVENDNPAYKWDHTPWLDYSNAENQWFINQLSNTIFIDLVQNCTYTPPTGSQDPGYTPVPIPGAETPGAPTPGVPGLDPSHPITPTCGDGSLYAPTEECDDHNTTSEDGCSSDCKIEDCGDHIVQGGLGEQCDDGNHADGDGCDAVCQIEGCGNGIVEDDEECDTYPSPECWGACGLVGPCNFDCTCLYHLDKEEAEQQNCTEGADSSGQL